MPRDLNPSLIIAADREAPLNALLSALDALRQGIPLVFQLAVADPTIEGLNSSRNLALPETTGLTMTSETRDWAPREITYPWMEPIALLGDGCPTSSCGRVAIGPWVVPGTHKFTERNVVRQLAFAAPQTWTIGRTLDALQALGEPVLDGAKLILLPDEDATSRSLERSDESWIHGPWVPPHVVPLADWMRSGEPGPHVQFRLRVTEGVINGHDAERLVQSVQAGIRFCYMNELRKNRALVATFQTELDVSPGGRVERVVVSQRAGRLERETLSCIRTSVSNAYLPRVGSGHLEVLWSLSDSRTDEHEQ